MNTVPSAVICGVYFQLEHRVDVLHGNGIVDGGLNRNFSTLLHRSFFVVCVTMRGLESSLPTPFASAAVMKKSIAKFGERCEKPKPDVGEPA